MVGGQPEDIAVTGPAALKRVRTATLEIAYEESGPADGHPVLLMHGFPYDVRAYDGVVPQLVAAGCRTIVPYLRGYGPTRFLSADTPRSGQQAALGADLLALMDALDLTRAVLAGRVHCRRPMAGEGTGPGLDLRL
jgi:pimeloyl-ACP methyl ester carboxylesterase